jgi:hypothetical protein
MEDGIFSVIEGAADAAAVVALINSRLLWLLAASCTT